MKKLNLMFMSLLMAGMGIAFTACSSDNNDPKPEELVLDADTLQVFDGFDVKFQMLNAQGRPVTKFKEGENITFKLAVTNKQKETFELIADFIGMDAFAFSPPLVMISACHGMQLSQKDFRFTICTSRNRL